MLDEPLGNLAADGTCGSLAGDDTLRIVEDDILAARVPAGRFRRAGSVCRPTWGPPTASRIGSCGCGRSKRDSVPPTRSPRTTRRWSARRSKPCSTRSRTVRLPWSSKAPRPPPAQTRLPRPFCDALEAGLRAEFHETEWKICYGLDSLVEGFIRRRDVPPADVPPVPFDATAFRAVSDEFVALAAPVREAPWGPIGSRKPRPLCGGCAAVTTRCKYPARSGGSWLLRLRKRRPGNIPSPGITRHGRCGRPIAIAFETTCVRR